MSALLEEEAFPFLSLNFNNNNKMIPQSNRSCSTRLWLFTFSIFPSPQRKTESSTRERSLIDRGGAYFTHTILLAPPKFKFFLWSAICGRKNKLFFKRGRSLKMVAPSSDKTVETAKKRKKRPKTAKNGRVWFS